MMTAIGIAFMGTLVALEDWLDRKFREDIDQGMLISTRRFCYGAVREWNTGRYLGTYVAIRTSSYAWGWDMRRQQECWCERVIIRDPHTGTWRTVLDPKPVEYT